MDAVNAPEVISFYQKNGFQMLFSSEKQEITYTIGGKDVTTTLDTRLMYFDLLNMRGQDTINPGQQDGCS